MQVGSGYSRTFKASFTQAFCGWYLWQKEKNEADEFYNAVNSYHEKLKLILQMVPIKFYDTDIIGSNSKFTTQVYNKMKKLPVYWTSQIPVRHKCNAQRIAQS